MSSDAFIARKLAAQERGTFYTAFLALEILIAIAAIFTVLRIWGIDLLELISQFLMLFEFDMSQLPSALVSILPQLETSVDPLVIIVETIVFFLMTLGLGLTIWYGYNVWGAWQWRIWGYRTILTVSVGAIMFTIIVMESIPLTLVAIVHLLIVLAVAHTKFYPEYRGQNPESLIRDLRVIRVATQIVFAFIIFFVLKLVWTNVYATLAARNALPTFDFLFRRSGFQINQSPAWYSSNSRYGDAFVVGVINTLQVVSAGLVAATVLGVLLGIFLLSNNWLIRTISRVYVEILRNTPLLVQLIFWYFVLWLSFPPGSLALPEVSVMVLPLRFFPYLFALIGIAYYVWRYPAPPRTMTGVFTGILVFELSLYLLGDSYAIIIGLAILGAALIFISMQEGRIRSDWIGFVRGIGIMAIVQLVGHLILDAIKGAGIIENARFVYGEVQPLIFLGPNVFGIPRFIPTLNFGVFILILIIGMVITFFVYRYWGTLIDRTGADIPRTFYAILIILAIALAAWLYASKPISPESQITIGEGDDAQTLPLSQVLDEGLLDEEELIPYQTEAPIAVQLPSLNPFGTRVQKGINISPNYMALLIGLVIYTSAFIGEIVRAGIQAVPYGQIEAARALGLSTTETLQMIVLPQALRVIIPPMGNQYLNLSKNSSLAAAIAFSDTYQVGQTVMNQSGQSITGFFIVLLVYLSLSLIISLFMNYVNSRFQLVTR
jgi:His/Glu/Gln/Arg/opine family amino acid ABC transporter permease subunit